MRSKLIHTLSSDICKAHRADFLKFLDSAELSFKLRSHLSECNKCGDAVDIVINYDELYIEGKLKLMCEDFKLTPSGRFHAKFNTIVFWAFITVLVGIVVFFCFLVAG